MLFCFESKEYYLVRFNQQQQQGIRNYSIFKSLDFVNLCYFEFIRFDLIMKLFEEPQTNLAMFRCLVSKLLVHLDFNKLIVLNSKNLILFVFITTAKVFIIILKIQETFIFNFRFIFCLDQHLNLHSSQYQVMKKLIFNHLTQYFYQELILQPNFCHNQQYLNHFQCLTILKYYFLIQSLMKQPNY